MPDNLIQTLCEEDTALHIASVVVQVRPDAMTQIKNWVEIFPGAEIHLEDVRGRLVVILEAESERQILDLLDGLNAQEGVFNAALVYHEILNGHEVLTGHEILNGQEIPTGESPIL